MVSDFVCLFKILPADYSPKLQMFQNVVWIQYDDYRNSKMQPLLLRQN